MGKSGALSCLNEPRDEQKHKPQLFPAGLGEPLFDRRNVFILIRHDTASPSPEFWDSVFSCDPPVASSGAHPFIFARRVHAWRVLLSPIYHDSSGVLVDSRRALALNIPFMYIAARMGHENDEMVRRVYGHLMAQKQDDINDLMTNYFK